MKSILFASSNDKKYREVKSLLSHFDIDVQFVKKSLIEIQAESLEIIALTKSNYAFLEISTPVIVEDDGLFIEVLNGFPGQYSSFIFETIGNGGIIKLLQKSNSRHAFFKSVFAFNNGRNSLTFGGETRGTIARKLTKGGWGYDPIFIPHNSDLTFGILETRGEKDLFSHRAKALKKFGDWFSRHTS
ncbi:MAG: non-canonical purine NTP pyrophosphatase [Nitrososphaeraceae archaeon]